MNGFSTMFISGLGTATPPDGPAQAPGLNAWEPNTLEQRYLQHAPALAVQAGERALANAGLDASQIDAVIVSTFSGALCPGLSGCACVMEGLGLRTGIPAFDLVGQACAGALPNLQQGHALLQSNTCGHVLSVCVEVGGATPSPGHDAAVAPGECRFGDGAGSAVLSQHPGLGGRRIEWIDSASFIDPLQHQAEMFEQHHAVLHQRWARPVPHVAALHATRVLGTVLDRAGMDVWDIQAWIMHADGGDVLQAVEREIGLKPADLRYSADTLTEHGNLSSACVYFVLQAALADNAPSGGWWLSSFGAGSSCQGALLEVH
jgi:predicted naringenin-chalcone synthase